MIKQFTFKAGDKTPNSTMKKYYFTLLISIAALFNSCIYDFEEGNDFSFRTISQRVEGKWYIRGVWVNGIDSSGYFPYNQYTQKDSLTLEFAYDPDYNTEKVRYMKSSVDFREEKVSSWHVTNTEKIIEIKNLIRGFESIFFEKKTVSYWKIVGCRNKRLVLDLSRYYSDSNNGERTEKQLRILLKAV